jgi:hypothetical protein
MLALLVTKVVLLFLSTLCRVLSRSDIAMANRRAAASRPSTVIPVPATPSSVSRQSIVTPGIRHASPARIGIGSSRITPISSGVSGYVAELVKSPQQQSIAIALQIPQIF